MPRPFFKEKVLSLPDGIEMEDVESTLFAKYFIKCRSSYFLAKSLSGVSIKISSFGEIVRLRGLKGDGCWNGYNEQFYIDRREATQDGWIIRIGMNKILWRCPDSSNLEYLPCGPWYPVHPSAEGKCPVIQYG